MAETFYYCRGVRVWREFVCPLAGGTLLALALLVWEIER